MPSTGWMGLAAACAGSRRADPRTVLAQGTFSRRGAAAASGQAGSQQDRVWAVRAAWNMRSSKEQKHRVADASKVEKIHWGNEPEKGKTQVAMVPRLVLLAAARLASTGRLSITEWGRATGSVLPGPREPRRVRSPLSVCENTLS